MLQLSCHSYAKILNSCFEKLIRSFANWKYFGKISRNHIWWSPFLVHVSVACLQLYKNETSTRCIDMSLEFIWVVWTAVLQSTRVSPHLIWIESWYVRLKQDVRVAPQHWILYKISKLWEISHQSKSFLEKLEAPEIKCY